jgi:hypothetical protein
VSRDVDAECFRCGAPATETFGDAYLCEDCSDALDSGDESAASASAEAAEENAVRGARLDNYAEASFASDDLARDEWPAAHRDHDAWMCRKDGKAPWSPWTDPDAPVACTHGAHDEPTSCDACRHSARFKWGSDGSREYVHAGFDTAREWCEKHPEARDDLAFIQREADPFVFVDGDDVRDPETGAVCPEFLDVLDRLGVTYTDVSQSGTGVHALYRGALPDGVKQVQVELTDEPFGANDDTPDLEIYDGKHVCIATGDHVAGTGLRVEEWDDDAIHAILGEHDLLPSHDEPASAFDDFDAEEYDAEATSADETAADIRDVFAAIDRLDARRVAGRTIVHEWNDSASTSADHRAFAPTWGPSANGTANIVDRERWLDTGGNGYGGAVAMAAINAGLVEPRNCPEGVSGSTWFDAVDHLRDLGFAIPELADSVDVTASDRDDPRDVEVVLDPGRAWRAAGLVEPADLPDDHGLATAPDGSAFVCPDCGDAVDVVRAAALDRGLVDGCGDPLDEDYATAYTAAREEYEAPIPRIVSAADAVYQYDTVLGAVRELDFFHLSPDALRCDVTGEGDDVDGEAVLTLDPTPVDGWRDSDSGESVLVFPSGTVYDVDGGDGDDRGHVLDALRFVALDSGVIDQPGDPLGGSDFCETYRLAREVYDAPLPRWFAAEANDAVRANVPLLPAPEQLLGEGDALAAELDDLDDVYREVGDLVADATDPEAGDRPTVVASVPATGKTTAAIRNARDQPTTYLAPRLELQAQAVEKAAEAGVSVDVLPVFSDGSVADHAVAQAVEHVREHGKDALRDRWRLVEIVNGEIFDDSGDEDDDDDSEDSLDRATCATAAGEYGEAWALVVNTARALGFTPREIHSDSRGLFGADAIPCDCCDNEADEDVEDPDTAGCPYSTAWEQIGDRVDPADLLIGSYGHAYVEGARTYRTGTRRDPEDRPRAVVIDEWPGDQFASDYGPEAFGFAAWLARSLRPDVEALADVDTDLAGDEFVRTYLDGEVADAFPRVRDALTGIAAVREAREAAAAAATIRAEVDADRLDGLGVANLLDQLVEAWGEADGLPTSDDRTALARELLAAVEDVRPNDRDAGVAGWVRDDVVDPLLDASGPDVRDALNDTPAPGDGPLAAVVESALDVAADLSHPQRGARAALDAADAALRGGPDGVRELAVWSDDGHAHPDAGYILRAVITPTDDQRADRVRTSGYDYPSPGRPGEGTVLKSVSTAGRSTTLVDENRQGATILDPPGRSTGGGDTAPVVGLDATARAELWRFSLGEQVELADVHDGPRERAEFLHDHLGLSVIQMSRHARPYMGDPDGKDTDGDVALVEHLADNYTGVYGAGDPDQIPTTVGDPAVITSKAVEDVLARDDRLDGKVSTSAHYGDLDGRNDLGDYHLAALLGSSHYGDHYVERLSALVGEEVERDGRGMNLDYGSAFANDVLRGMREDRVAQAILRFARGDSGAVVFCRTAALRDDLPLRGEGRIANTYTPNATRIARAVSTLDATRERFTAGDVVDQLGEDAPSRRTVRRVLASFASAGYVERDRGGVGTAYGYQQVGEVPAGEVEAPTVDIGGGEAHPDKTRKRVYYTASVRVAPLDSLLDSLGGGGSRVGGVLPAPGTAPERASAGVGPPE